MMTEYPSQSSTSRRIVLMPLCRFTALGLVVALTCIAGCRPAPENADSTGPSAPPSTNVLYGRYTITWTQYCDDQTSNTLVIAYDARPVYTYIARHITNDLFGPPRVGLAYEFLTDRGGCPQPKPLDDILRCGSPCLVVNEWVPGGSAGGAENWLTVLMLNGSRITEIPAVPCAGEVYYFADFDTNGVLEIVNTDAERDFRYGPDGVPLSPYVWRFDPKMRRYRRTLEEGGGDR